MQKWSNQSGGFDKYRYFKRSLVAPGRRVADNSFNLNLFLCSVTSKRLQWVKFTKEKDKF